MATAAATEDAEMADAEATEEGNNEGGDGGEEMDDGGAGAAADDNDADEQQQELQQPFSLDARRRLKQEAYVTRGCGKNEVKTRTVDTFWETVWPALELLGWIKVPGTGAQIGSMNFIPYGASQETRIKGTDYYDKIKDVLDRIQERRNDEEAKIADAYDAEIVHKQEVEEARKKSIALAAASAAAGQQKQQQQQQKRKRKFRAFAATKAVLVVKNRDSINTEAATASKLLHPLDLSWKDAGRIFPKRQSQIGPDYQVSTLPEAGSYTPPETGQELRTLIWDPVVALEKGAMTKTAVGFETILDQIPCNKKEAALLLLAERGYDPTDFEKVVQDSIQPTDGSDWNESKKKDFHYHVFRTRKDLSTVCKTLGISMESCLLYYYGKFKQTDDYRFVKTICNDENAAARSSRQFEGEQDACAVCDDGGSLVICDGCEGEYHIGCMRPPLKSVPEGHWECDECVDRKVLAVHDFLIRTTALFQRDTGSPSKAVAAKSKEGQDGDGADDTKNSSGDVEDCLLASPSLTTDGDKKGFRPTAASIASIRKLAGSISEAFTGVPKEEKEGAIETPANIDGEPAVGV